MIFFWFERSPVSKRPEPPPTSVNAQTSSSGPPYSRILHPLAKSLEVSHASQSSKNLFFNQALRSKHFWFSAKGFCTFDVQSFYIIFLCWRTRCIRCANMKCLFHWIKKEDLFAYLHFAKSLGMKTFSSPSASKDVRNELCLPCLQKLAAQIKWLLSLSFIPVIAEVAKLQLQFPGACETIPHKIVLPLMLQTDRFFHLFLERISPKYSTSTPNPSVSFCLHS